MKYILPAIFIIAALTACNASKRINKDFLYFQRGLDSMGKVQYKAPPIQKNDLLSIQVYSGTLNQEQALLFNLPNTGGNATATVTQGLLLNSTGYLVDMDGNITMPLIGNIQAAGLTRQQLAAVVTEKVAPFVKNPNVLIRFLQFKINVLGEVKQPGTQNFNTDRVTLLEAISAAGDLTDKGKREDVVVVREVDSTRKYYQVDLRSASLFQSPVYQLLQNDIVYVGANKNKLKEVNMNPNFQRDLQTSLTVISFAALLISIINVLK